MKQFSFDVLKSCLDGLERSLAYIQTPQDTVDYELFRDAAIKKFEMTIEQLGKILRKLIPEYTGNKTAAAKMPYKELLRYGGQFGLIDDVEKWMAYRDARNDTAHEYGEDFAIVVLPRLQQFVVDGRALLKNLEAKHGQS